MSIENKLKDLRIYLSGPIEHTKDDGVDWRQKFTKLSEENKLNLKIMDPTDKDDCSVGEIAKAREKLRQLKENGKFDEVTETMKSIRHWDLRACDYAHAIIVNIDPDVPTWGTVDECLVAERQQKPVFAVIAGGPKKAPDWAFTHIRWQEMFDSLESLMDYLIDLHVGKAPLDSRWVIIRNG